MSLRDPTRLGIIETCLSSPAKAPPSGPGWIHEIKRFRILARRNGAGVRLITRAGNHFSPRFPFLAMAVKSLPVRSCLIEGEAIDGEDLWRQPIEKRKASTRQATQGAAPEHRSQ